MRLRRSELFFCVFLLYAMALGALRPIDPALKWLLLTLNPALIGWFFLLAWADRHREPTYLGMVRDWFLFPMILLAYRKMGWLASNDRTRALENFAIVCWPWRRGE